MSLLNFTWFPPDTVTGITSLELGSDPYLVTDVRDLSGLPTEPATSRGPFQPGETLLDNRVSGRRFSVFIEILADSESDYWDRRDELSHAFSVVPRFDQRTAETGLLRLTRTGKDDIELPCVPVNAPRFENISPLFLTAEISMFAPSPWWRSIDDIIEFFESSGGIAIPEGIVAVSGGVIQVTNDWTHERDDEATYFDSSGTLKTAAANDPRTTYIDGNPYLLMEGERTNRFLHSESFDESYWSKQNISISADAIDAPDGNQTADKIVEDTSSNRHRVQSSSVSYTSGNTYAVSIFAKGTERNLYINFATAFNAAATFDLSAETASASSGVARIRSVGNGWYKCTVTGTATSTHSAVGYFQLAETSGDDIYTGDGSSGLHLWGAQNEEGTPQSSYIATTTAAVTRASDSASLANSIITGLTEGVLYMEILSEHLTSDAARHIAELESDSNNFIRAQLAADGDIDGQITDGGTSQAALAGPAHTPGTLHKVALVFGPSGFALYSDGVQRDTGTGTVPSVDTLLIGAGLFGGIAKLIVHVQEWSQSEGEANTT